MYGDFASLSFPKRGSDIKQRAGSKLKKLSADIDEKSSQLQQLCEERNLTIQDMLLDLDSLRGRSSAHMPSADMAKLQQLASRIDEMKKEAARLELILRNLPDNNEYNLTFEELRYFEF